MSKPTNTDIDFIEVAASLFKHKILIIILVLIGAAGGFTFSVYKTPVFKHNISVKTPVSLASNKAYVENSEVFLILNSLSKDILANKKSASAKYGIAEELAMQIKSINFAQNPTSQSIIDIKLLTYSKESIKNISTFLIS
jgi:LPS O-antigen subunit length determinant protein (WzzB/FepE family)